MRCSDLPYVDLEREFCPPDGIPESYIFKQTKNMVMVSLPVPENTTSTQMIFLYNSNDGSIIAGLEGTNPMLCGKVYQKATKQSMKIEGNFFNLTFKKAIPDDWPLLIKSSSPEGIDPKSLTILAFKDIKNGNFADAFEKFKAAADAGFEYAIVATGKLMINPPKEYGITPQIEQGIILLMSDLVNRSKLDDETLVHLSDALISLDRVDDAIQLLEPFIKKSTDIAVAYIKATSPLYYGNMNTKFQAILQIEKLISANDPLGYLFKAEHVLKGVGYDYDKVEFEQLIAKVIELDHTLFPLAKDLLDQDRKKTSIPTIIGIGVAVAAVAIGLFYIVYKRNKK